MMPPTERTGPSFFGLFLTNPGLWPVILYLIGSTVGMLDSWWFYRRFGINVFLYSDIADFLLASFREPGVWILVALFVFCAMGDSALSLRVGRSARPRRWLSWYGSARYRRITWAAMMAVLIAYIPLVAGYRADAFYDGRRGKDVEVTFATDARATKRATLLGSTVSFLFLYDRVAGKVSIHPYENVLAVDSIAPRRAP